MKNSNLEDIVLFLVVSIFISNYFLFVVYKKNESLDSDLDELKNEHINLKSSYNEDIEKVNNRFKQLYAKVNTIPVIDSKIDKRVDDLLKKEKLNLEKYVLDAFKKDEYSSKTISLKAILKNEKNSYSKKFDNLFNAI